MYLFAQSHKVLEIKKFESCHVYLRIFLFTPLQWPTRWFDCHGWWWRLLVCTYLPFQSPWNKVLQWALFMKLTYMGTYRAKCWHYLSLLFERTLFQDFIVTADDEDFSFAPTFPSKVLGINSCNGLFSWNLHIWAPTAPIVFTLWLWGGMKCMEGHYLRIWLSRLMMTTARFHLPSLPKSCNGLFSWNRHMWAPTAPNVLALWFWRQI